SNYSLTVQAASFAITPRAVTVTADAGTKTYGELDPSLTYHITAGTLADGDAFAGALVRQAGESVGSYAITSGSLSLGSNYSLPVQPASFAITPRQVTVTADAGTKSYGDADPALTYHITAGTLADGDAFTGALVRQAGESVGSYAITAGSLSLGSNYSLTVQPAPFAITPRQVT